MEPNRIPVDDVILLKHGEKKKLIAYRKSGGRMSKHRIIIPADSQQESFRINRKVVDNKTEEVIDGLVLDNDVDKVKNYQGWQKECQETDFKQESFGIYIKKVY